MPSSAAGWVVVGAGALTTGGASLTFLEQATAAVHSSATSRTRLVAFMAIPRLSQVDGTGLLRDQRARYGPQAGSRTSPSASTSRWRTRASADTAYSTPRPPSLAAYSSMLALGAKLGDSSIEPGESIDQRGEPRLRSISAMRYVLPLPWVVA